MKKTLKILVLITAFFPSFAFAAPSGASYLANLLRFSTTTTGCLQGTLTSSGIVTAYFTGTDCGSGGGGSGGGTWSTTTSSVSGVLFNYPNNADDVVLIGSNSSSTAEFVFDPNTLTSWFLGRLGLGTTSPSANYKLSVSGNVHLGGNITSTSTSPSTLPYASSTAITVSGTASTTNLIVSNSTTLGALTGILQAINGLVSASSSISTNFIENLSGTNTGDVTLAGTPDYITLANQVITRGLIDLTTDISGVLPIANGGTNASTLSQANPLAFNGTSIVPTTTPTAQYFIATSSIASRLPYSSSTAITVSGTGYFDKLGVASSSPSANHSLVVSGNAHFGGSITSTSTTATSTFLAPVSLPKIVTSATSTGSNGFDITAGCYAVSGTCIGGGSGSGTVGSGTAGQFPYYSSDGTTLTATSSVFVTTASKVGIGTTTPQAQLTVSSDNNSQLGLSAGAGFAQWNFRNQSGDLCVASTTVGGTATTTTCGATLNDTGVPALTVGSSTPMNTVKNGTLVLGGGGDSAGVTGTSTIITGKIQFDGLNAAGERVCLYIVGTTPTVTAGACTP